MGDPRAEHDTQHDDHAVNVPAADVTGEVGSEGGTPGEMEVETDREAGTGSEAGETWQPSARRRRAILRDEDGPGKRSP